MTNNNKKNNLFIYFKFEKNKILLLIIKMATEHAKFCLGKKLSIIKLLETSDRLDIDSSLAWDFFVELEGTDPSAERIVEKMIEKFPEKKCFNDCKEATEDEFYNNF